MVIFVQGLLWSAALYSIAVTYNNFQETFVIREIRDTHEDPSTGDANIASVRKTVSR